MTTGAAIGGKYRLIRQLGQGSMAEVWAAEHVELGREVALKLIYEGSPELATRLKREAQACGRLYHPNIVRVYDFGETETGDPFLVMELLTGETLAERMARKRRLSVDEALSIILRVVRALGAAHDAGIVHRDLKPANVFLAQTPQGEVVKVLDFGVSKMLAVDDMGVTTTGALVGSPAYMSPEQARALREIDARADLWSVGVLLFEMLTGKRPFPAQTVVAVVTEILAGPIPTLAEALPGVDPRLDAAVRRCLTRDVDKRMPSATALIDALAPVLASLRAEDDEDDDQKTLARPGNAALLAPAPADDPDDPTAVIQARHAFPFPASRGAEPPRRPEPPRIELRSPASPREEATRVEPRPRAPAELPRLAPPPAEPPRLAPLPAAPPLAPPPAVNMGDTTARIGVPPASLAPNSDEMPTLAGPRQPEQQDSQATTRLIANPYAVHPSPAASAQPGYSAWDMAPTLRRTPPVPQQVVVLPHAQPALLDEDLPLGTRSRSQVLWMTAIAGIVLGLVVFAGLSLFR
jgi:serine/threonine-protein kinase